MSTGKEKITKGRLIADLKYLAEKHGDISRDFYRKQGAFGGDAWASVFPNFEAFKSAAGIKPPEPVKVVELSPEHRVQVLKEKEQTKRSQRREELTHLMQENDNLRNRLNSLLAFEEMTPQEFVIEPKLPSGRSESTAVLLCSDWHNEEEVDPRKVNGVNEFNLDIFAKRAKRLAQNTQRLWYIMNKDTSIKSMIVALLGDFLSGNIHDDITENNLAGMNEAILNAHEKISGLLRFLLDNTDLEEIVVPCHSGNHGRLTKEQRIATEAQNSIEYTMYRYLQREFKDEPRLKFLVSEGYMSHVVLYDSFNIRFHHGHAFKYGGGVGGIYIPVNKKINEWNKTRVPNGKGGFLPPVSLDCFGHFHQYIDAGNFVCNSSLIGYNAFAQVIGAATEPPSQAFFLVNKKFKAKTMATPIFVSE